jgi:hypothetical protein
MSAYKLVREYDVAMVHTFTIEVTDEELDQYRLDFPDPDGVDYEDMFDYFEAKGHTVYMEDEAIDYQNNGVTFERI